MIKMHKIIFYILIGFLAAANVQAENMEDRELRTVLEQLAQIKRSNSGFIETKTISLLDNEVQLSGLLEYTAPDILVKQTLKPAPEVFKVTGNDLHIKNAVGEETELLLTNYPLVEMFVEAYRGILAGDLKKLARFYNVKFKGNSKHWVITLTPIEDEALEYIERITVEGQGAVINKFETLEASGDKSTLLINKK